MKKVLIALGLLIIGILISIISHNILPLIVMIVGIIIISLIGVILSLKNNKNVDRKYLKSDIIFLIVAILSLFTSTIWYLTLILATLSLIYSIRRIKEDGSTIAKVATSFSIVGIVNCALIYISIIMIIIVNS